MRHASNPSLLALVALTCILSTAQLANADTALSGVFFKPLPQHSHVGFAIAASGNSTLGWSFKTNDPIWLTHLGFYDHGKDGLAFGHRVGIWDEEENLLASVLVRGGTASKLSGSYRYQKIAPLILPAGHVYTIAATVPFPPQLELDYLGSQPTFRMDGYPFYYNVRANRLHFDDSLQLLNSSLEGYPPQGPEPEADPPGVLSFPNIDRNGGYFFAANFRFGSMPPLLPTATPVPEGNLSLIALGAAAIICASRPRRRLLIAS